MMDQSLKLPHDIEGIYKMLLPWWSRPSTWIAVGFLLFLAVVLYFLWKRVRKFYSDRNKKAADNPLSKIDFIDEQIRLLSEYFTAHFDDQNYQKKLYSQLSWSLRAGWEHLTHDKATDLTFEEFQHFLEKSGQHSQESAKRMLDILARAQYVCFADQAQNKDRCLDDVKDAVSLLQNWKMRAREALTAQSTTRADIGG